MKTLIKLIYYKVFTILASQPWIQLILKLLLYFLLLYIMVIMSKPPGPSSEDIDIYKELLAEYQLNLQSLEINTIQHLMNSVAFVIAEFEAIAIWSPTLEIITKSDNLVALYVQEHVFMFPQLTADEKVLHFNYLSTILTYDYIQLPNKTNNNFNEYLYFNDIKTTLMGEAAEVLDQNTKLNVQLLLLYSIMAVVGTLAICVSTYV